MLKTMTAVLVLAILAVSRLQAFALGPAAAADEPLVRLAVVDAETGAPVERFVVVPGVPYSDRNQPPIASWQPHLVRESTGGQYDWPRARSYKEFRLRVEADGYRPSNTPWIRAADGPKKLTIQLRKDAGLRGVIVTQGATPAAGAVLGIALPNRTLRLNGRTIEHAFDPPAAKPSDRWRQPIAVRADADGRFRLPAESDPAALLVVVHESGYLERPLAELLGPEGQAVSARILRLNPWGRISGRLLWGDRPAGNEPVELIVSHEFLYPDMVGTFSSATTSAEGRFEFRDIPPGRVQLSHLVKEPNGKGTTQYQFPVRHIEIRPGEATEVILGGRGRVVTGRLTGLETYEGVTLRIHPRAPHIGFDGDDAQWRGWSALQKSPFGPTVFRDAIPVARDGTYRIEGLVPESYQLMVNAGRQQLFGGTQFQLEPASNAEPTQELDDMRVGRKAP